MIHAPTTIGAFEAKTNLSQLLDRVASGEEIVITRHGKPVARLVPYTEHRIDPTEVEAAFARLRADAAKYARGVTQQEIRSFIEEGRE